MSGLSVTSDSPAKATTKEMMRARPDTVDVLVVGFGPVGAVLTGLLGKRGIDVMVIERDYEVFSLPRAAHVDHTGLRTWQELGVLDGLLPTMQPNLGLDFIAADGELLARIPSDQPNTSGLPTSMYFFQPTLDRAVREAVSAMPSVRVQLGTEVTGVVNLGDHVLVSAIAPDGRQLDIAAKWVVACDGAASGIREQLGLGVENLHFEEPWLVVDIVLPEESSEPGRATCRCDPARPTYSIPMPLHRHRFEFRFMDGDEQAEMLRTERISELVAPWFPDQPFEVERAAIYTFHGLVAEKWRQHRVFLAGDAAHQMPPFLGQGMCSGLRDATNLAWKLDLVLHGNAPDELLDTYAEERRAHVRSIVEAAVRIGRIICTIDPDEAAERDRRMLADPRRATQRIGFALPGLRPGPLVGDNGGDLFVQSTGPDGRLDDVIGPRFAVLARTPALLEGGPADWWRDRADAFVATASDLPAAHATAVLSWLDGHHSDVVVVRPDRYVLWAGPDLDAMTRKVAAILGE
jgi:3-(3-hydroxy-phenyl)propionate hydroxylase